MRQNLFKSIAVALVAVATLASTKSAKADVFGMALGYQVAPSRIAIDFLVPLKHHGAKRPQGGVLNFGLNIRGDSRRRGTFPILVPGYSVRRETGKNFDWIGFSLPIAYEYVFDSGISILAGAEFLYYSNKEDYFSRAFISNKKDREYGGGIVIGTHYFFKSGVFLGLRVSAGAVHQTNTFQSEETVPNADNGFVTYVSGVEGFKSVYGYVAPTFSVGYMF